MDLSEFNPKVSIVIPVYNGSNFLKQAIDSALAQTYSNLEIIVVNDGSRDDGATEQIALSYGDKIRYIYKENGGVSSALNTGIKSMSGEYFSWLSHDDMYLPEKVEKQVAALCSAGENNTLALCAFKCIDKDGNAFSGKHKAKLGTGYHSWNDALYHMFMNGTFNGCAFLIPKAVLDVVGGFDETLKYSQDALMWMKIFLSEYNIVGMDEELVCNRVHNGQLTQTGKALFHSDSEKISEKVVPMILSKEKHAKKLLYAYARNSAKYNNKAVVKKCFAASKENKLLGFFQRMKIRFVGMYGSVRPTIRKIYYKLFRKVKTQ